MKNIIKLNERELHQLISESVKKVLMEDSYKSIPAMDIINSNHMRKITFKPFEISNCYDYENIAKTNKNAEIFVDEDDADADQYVVIVDDNYKCINVGKCCSAVFEGGDGVFDFLWSTNNGKSAHVVSASGKVVSKEYVASCDFEDRSLLVDADNNVYMSAWWTKKHIALFYANTPFCKKDDILGCYDYYILFFKGKNKKRIGYQHIMNPNVYGEFYVNDMIKVDEYGNLKFGKMTQR